MYYSVVLRAENQKRMFAINAELVSGDSDMFTAVMRGLSNYRMSVPLIESRRKCKKFAHEIGALCTFHHSYEEIINMVYNHKFYRTEKIYETLYDTKEYHCDLSKFRLEIGDFFIGGPYSDVNQKYLFFKIFGKNTPFHINYGNLAKIMSDELGYPVIVGRNNWLYIRNVHERSYIQSVDGEVTLTIVKEEQVECGEKEVLITK